MPYADPEVRRAFMKAHAKAHYAKNRDHIRIARVVRDETFKAEQAEYGRAYRSKNKAKIAARMALYASKNLARHTAKQAARKARKLRATPAWSSKVAVDAVYELARLAKELTGVDYSVDHIVPLKSKIVCGLHVQWNLRVISQFENSSKGNYHWPDMP